MKYEQQPCDVDQSIVIMSGAISFFEYEASKLIFSIFVRILVLMVAIEIINNSPHELPAYQTAGASGMDIRAWLKEPVVLQSLERKLIPTGLFIAIPPQYEGQIRPRSGLAIKKGLTLINTPGTIDSDYRGELMIPLVNLSADEQSIEDGDRIAQIIFAKFETIEWNLVTILQDTARGTGGFGHSGVN